MFSKTLTKNMELFPHTVTCPSSRDWRHVRTPPSQFQTIRHVTTDHKKTTSKTEKEMQWSRRSHDIANYHLNSWRVRQEFSTKNIEKSSVWWSWTTSMMILVIFAFLSKETLSMSFYVHQNMRVRMLSHIHVRGVSSGSNMVWFISFKCRGSTRRPQEGTPKQGKYHGHDKHKKRMIERCCEVKSEMGRSVQSQKLKHAHPAKAYTIHMQSALSPQQSGHSLSSTHSDERTPESCTHSNLS